MHRRRLSNALEVVRNHNQSFQADFFPSFLQRFLQGFDVRVGLPTRFFFKNRPNRIVHRVEIRAIWRPFAGWDLPMAVDCDHIRTILSKPVLCLLRFMGLFTILLKRPLVVPESRVGPWNQMRVPKSKPKRKIEESWGAGFIVVTLYNLTLGVSF